MTRGSQDPRAPAPRPGGQALARRALPRAGGGAAAGGARSSHCGRLVWRRRAPCARHMGRLTEAAAAGGGASAARSAGPPPAPLPLSSTSPGCAAAMASSEEDGTNGGASEASEEREAVGKRRRLGLLATIWLTFYNIAMTAGYVRPEGALPRRRAPDFARSARWRSVPGSREGRRGAGCACARVAGGRGAGVLAAQEGGAGSGRGGRGAAPRSLNGAGRGGRAVLARHCLIRCTARAAAAGRGPEVKYRPGQECGADPRGRRPPRAPLPPLLVKKRGVPPPPSPELSGEWPQPSFPVAGPWTAQPRAPDRWAEFANCFCLCDFFFK